MENITMGKIIQWTVLSIIGVTLFFGSYATVSPGNKGVRVTMGRVSDETLANGFYFKLPLVQRIVEMDGHNIKWSDTTQAYTKDIQQANFITTLNLRLQPERANQVYRDVGENWQDTLVPQAVRDSLKSVIGKWDAVVLIENRQKAADEISSVLASKLDKRGIEVITFAMENIDFNDEFEKANEAKVTAVQRAIEAENRTKQIQEEAKQQVITAKAAAESMQIRSQALAQNHGLVEYEAVQKWDGKLPQYMLGGTTPFINLGKSVQ